MTPSATRAVQVLRILACHLPPAQPMPDYIQVRIETAIACEAKRRTSSVRN